jgi:hypothetical protein
MPSARPVSVLRVAQLVYSIIGLLAVAALLTFLLHDQLVRSWAKGNHAAQVLLREGGIPALERSTIHVPGFSALALTGCVIYAMLAWVLVSFFLGRHHWARWSLVAMMLFTTFVGGVGLSHPLPAAFVVVCVLGMLVALSAVVVLLRRDVTDFLRLL